VIHGKYFYHFIYSIKKTYQVGIRMNNRKGPDLQGFLPTWQVCESDKSNELLKSTRPNRSNGSVVIHGKYFYHLFIRFKKTYQVRIRMNNRKGPDLQGFLPTWQVCEKSKTQWV